MVLYQHIAHFALCGWLLLSDVLNLHYEQVACIAVDLLMPDATFRH